MKILFCASEAYPLIKTGGLADVCGSLPRAVQSLGEDVRVMLPAFPPVLERAGDVRPIASLHLIGAAEPVVILEGRFPDSTLPLYLVDSESHFARPGNPYLQPDGTDWPDNAARFALFARAVVGVALGLDVLDWQPDLVHCNDWQTGLVPPLLALHEPRPATVFTVHNLSYQGLFSAATFGALRLPGSLWSIEGVEFHNQLSFLKGGIASADWVTTVSPTYAQEIRTPRYGYGLEGLLQYRSAQLAGVLNGMDDKVWNPATDPHIERRYDARALRHKLFNRSALQRELGLPVSARPLLLGHVGRLVEQKGVDLMLEVLDALFEDRVQLVILGTGDALLEQGLQEAALRHPEQLAVRIGYDEGLAHRIEAGCDAFLMPSRYEPCGLNQMYSLRYGTVPIVRRTGGLADTVVDLDERSESDYSATGFTFDDPSAKALLGVCRRALEVFQHRRLDWWKLVITGMREDYSWTKSARRYRHIYAEACSNRRAEVFAVQARESRAV